MDVHLITPDTALAQRQFWTAQSDSQDYVWQGRTAERLKQDKGASALELFDAVNGQLMQDLGISPCRVDVPGPDREPRLMECCAVRLIFGRMIDLAELWAKQGLQQLFERLLLETVTLVLHETEQHMMGVIRPPTFKDPPEGAIKTGSFAFTLLSDFADPDRNFVHAIIPCITHTDLGEWCYLEPRFWLVNQKLLADVLDNAMVEAYGRVTEHYRLGSLPRRSAWR